MRGVDAEGTALVAPDKFKGTLSAGEVAESIAAGIDGPVDVCPIADGGEGTAEILLGEAGGDWVAARAADPLGRPVDCRFALLADGATAVVEVAEASGLWRLGEGERDAVAAGSRGTGELLLAAREAGAVRILLACGGSATTDGAAGVLEVFSPRPGEITCLCDTDVGFIAAAGIYAPQKGADPEQVEELEGRLLQMVRELPNDPSRLPFTGAAGGLAGGLWAHGARLVPGAREVLSAVRFDERLATASTVVTGEGRLDSTSLRGKAVGEVMKRAARAGVPAHAIVGEDGREDPSAPAWSFSSVIAAGTRSEIKAAAATLRWPESGSRGE